MSVCKDCLHFEACLSFWHSDYGFRSLEDDREIFAERETCELFKPAADVVEVVRCKDCVHFTEGMAIGMCKRNEEKPIIPCRFDNYCMFGKRRENEG